MNLFPFLSANGGAEGATQQGSFFPLLMLILMFGVMYFILIRPQKKKQKEEAKMRSEIEVGDTITTIGGIMGRVVTVKEDSIIVETGADRIKVRFKKWAVATNDTPGKQPVQPERRPGLFGKLKKSADENGEGNSNETK